MDYNEMCRILNNSKSTKERLREALSFALGVEYKPMSKEKTESVFNDCKAVFCEFYKQETGLTYTFTGQDGKALKELIDKIKTLLTPHQLPPQGGEREDVIISKTFQVMLVKLPDWYRKNAFSLPVINKKFNEIVSSIKQSNEKGQSSISAGYKQKLIDDLQS